MFVSFLSQGPFPQGMVIAETKRQMHETLEMKEEEVAQLRARIKQITTKGEELKEQKEKSEKAGKKFWRLLAFTWNTMKLQHGLFAVFHQLLFGMDIITCFFSECSAISLLLTLLLTSFLTTRLTVLCDTLL